MTGAITVEVPDVGRYLGASLCPVATALAGVLAAWATLSPAWAQADEEQALVLTPESSAQMAAADSLPVRAAWRHYLDMTRGIDVAKTGSMGTVGVTGGITRQIPTVSFDIPDTGGGGPGIGTAISFPETTKELHVIAGQPVFDGGLTILNTVLARLDRQAAASQFRQAQGVAAMQGYEGAYRVLWAEQMLRVALFGVTSYMEHLRTASERFVNQTVSRLDVAAAEAQVAQARQVLAQAEAEAERAETDLKTVLSVDLEREVDVRPGVDLEPPDLAVEDMARIALAFREDFDAVLRAVQRIAGESLYPVVADLPRVDTFADYRHGTAFFSLPKDQFTIGIQGSLSVFDGGLGKAQRRQYRQRLESAKLDAEHQGRTVAEQVVLAYTAIEEQEQVLESARAAERAAQTELEIATLRYENEVAVGSEVLDAQARLAAAQSAVVNGQYEYNMANVRLRLAMGVLGSTPIGAPTLHPDLKIHVYDRRGEGRAALWWTGEGEARLMAATNGLDLKVRPLDDRERTLHGANVRFQVNADPLRIVTPDADGRRLFELLSAARVEPWSGNPGEEQPE